MRGGVFYTIVAQKELDGRNGKDSHNMTMQHEFEWLMVYVVSRVFMISDLEIEPEGKKSARFAVGFASETMISRSYMAELDFCEALEVHFKTSPFYRLSYTTFN